MSAPVDHQGRAVTGPKRPPAWRSWKRIETPLKGTEAYGRGRICVTSSLIRAQFRGELRWQWLVSISDRGTRPNDDQVAAALRDFGMTDAEEDNHHPGRARHFFRLCEQPPGQTPVCECKVDEQVVVEQDGYTWQRPRDEGEAREREEEMRRLEAEVAAAQGRIPLRTTR